MKKLLLAIMILIFSVILVSCYEDEADKTQREATVQAMAEAQRQVGMPNIVNFQQRKLMKLIYELCDKEDLICYAYIKSDYQGKLVYIGQCIGYGIPFSAQYTNPMKPITGTSPRYDETTIPQPDPNGLFMPISSSATWLMMLDPETNKPRPVYIEPEIVVSPYYR